MARIPAFQAGYVGSIPITCSKKKEVASFDVTSFLFVGIEQGRSNIYVAEENSPADCFRWRGNERSEAIGALRPCISSRASVYITCGLMIYNVKPLIYFA